MTFQFELDPTSLPKLQTRGDNYPEWKSSWTIAYKYAKLWDIVSGKSRREVTADTATWDHEDSKALVMMLSSVHTDLTMTVGACDTAAQAWSALKERFDRDTGNNVIYLFRKITSLRFRDDDDLRSHVDEFHQLWIKMQRRCTSSTHQVAKAMKTIFDSDQVKGSFFLSTLPGTMDGVVDNLSTRNISRFVDIESKMLDIADRKVRQDASSADYTSTATKPGKNVQRNLRSRTTVGDISAAAKECSRCKEHSLNFVGHVYTDCTHLQAYRDNKPHEKSTANTAVDHEDDHSDTQDDAAAFAAVSIPAVSPLICPKINKRTIDLTIDEDDIEIIASKVQSLSLSSGASSVLNF